MNLIRFFVDATNKLNNTLYSLFNVSLTLYNYTFIKIVVQSFHTRLTSHLQLADITMGEKSYFSPTVILAKNQPGDEVNLQT